MRQQKLLVCMSEKYSTRHEKLLLVYMSEIYSMRHQKLLMYMSEIYSMTTLLANMSEIYIMGHERLLVYMAEIYATRHERLTIEYNKRKALSKTHLVKNIRIMLYTHIG